MTWSYDGRRFRVANNSVTGETSSATTFIYRQRGNILWGTYEGGAITMGTLVGLVRGYGELEFHYSHVNTQAQICSGVCHSTPEILPDGRIRLQEQWRWTTGDCSEGESTLEEVA